MSLIIPVGKDDHVKGPEDAPVTLVEYGDYQCPGCGAAYPMVKAIQKRLGAKLRFVFRNMPLNEIHPNAEMAAEAAEAAGAQGKFWELHDARFRDHVKRDFMGGVRSGVNGTPTFFIDGTRYDGALEEQSLESALRQRMT